MSKPAYIPRPGSLPYQVTEFLVRNPDEELTIHDIAAKFGCPHLSVHTKLAQAVERGLLRRAPNSDLEQAYTKGPQAAASMLQATPSATRPAAQHTEDAAALAVSPFATVGSQRQALRRRKCFVLDVNRIHIEQGVPLPGRAAAPELWRSVFERMQPGDSFALPALARNAVSRAATAYKRATGVALAIRQTGEGLRVWRLPQ